MNDPNARLEDLKASTAGPSATTACGRCGSCAPLDDPTPEDALVAPPALRIEGDREARLAEQIEQACRAAA